MKNITALTKRYCKLLDIPHESGKHCEMIKSMVQDTLSGGVMIIDSKSHVIRCLQKVDQKARFR